MTERPSILDLSELEDDLVPEILPATATLSVNGSAAALRALFSRAAAVAPVKEVVPGTAYALLEADADHVRLTASDGEQTVSVVDRTLTVRARGSVLLPPKRVLDILRLAPSLTADISVVGSTALIRSGRARWTVQVPVAAPPPMTTLTLAEMLPTRQIGAQAFLQGLKGARVAASNRDRISLMQLHVHDSRITGCDMGRLHQVIVGPDLDPTIETTIPVKVVDELIKTLDGAETLEYGFDDTTLIFHVGDNAIVAKRLLLDYPDISQVATDAQRTNKQHLVVNRVELLEAIRRVRVNSDPDRSLVVLTILHGTGTLEVKSHDAVGNTAQESLACTWDGKDTEVGFNHRHLTDLLEVCTSETLTMRLGVDTKSSRLPLLVEDENVLGIVQQLTIHW